MDKLHELGPEVVVISSALQSEEDMMLYASYKELSKIKMTLPYIGEKN